MSPKIKNMSQDKFIAMMDLLFSKHFSLLEKLVQEFLEDDFLTIEQACDLLNYSKSTLYNLVQNQRIPFYRKGRALIFSKKELILWVKEGRGRQINNNKKTETNDE